MFRVFSESKPWQYESYQGWFGIRVELTYGSAMSCRRTSIKTASTAFRHRIVGNPDELEELLHAHDLERHEVFLNESSDESVAIGVFRADAPSARNWWLLEVLAPPGGDRAERIGEVLMFSKSEDVLAAFLDTCRVQKITPCL